MTPGGGGGGGGGGGAVATSPTRSEVNSVNHRLPLASSASVVASPVTPWLEPNACDVSLVRSNRSSWSLALSVAQIAPSPAFESHNGCPPAGYSVIPSSVPSETDDGSIFAMS